MGCEHDYRDGCTLTRTTFDGRVPMEWKGIERKCRKCRHSYVVWSGLAKKSKDAA